MSENTVMPAAAAPDVHWRNPAEDPPPRGVKLLLLTTGGVTILGGWTDNSNLVAWSPMPKRPPRLAPSNTGWLAWRKKS